jgi:hypothetical protein
MEKGVLHISTYPVSIDTINQTNLKSIQSESIQKIHIKYQTCRSGKRIYIDMGDRGTVKDGSHRRGEVRRWCGWHFNSCGRWYTRDWGGEWRIETFVSYGIKNLNATAQQRTVTEIQGEANDFLMRKVLARAELASQQGT